MSTLPPVQEAPKANPLNTNLDNQTALCLGNRMVVTDNYFHEGIENEPTLYRNKVYVRLSASKKTVFRKISFTHCVFEDCYLPYCTFDTCDFTGCKFVGTNFYQSVFSGCKFWYTTFERTQIDDDILICEAPIEENLRVRFARTLRMNFTQLGDAKAVNNAISVELKAREKYLRASWSPRRSYYYRIKYPKWQQLFQFFRWIEFRVLDFIWGNGESIIKLARTIALIVVTIAIYDAVSVGNALDLAAYWRGIEKAPGVFFGVEPTDFSPLISALIAGCRYIGLALLTALLVKRFGRR